MERNSKIFPFVWPWKNSDGDKLSAKETLLSRKFTLFYLAVIWALVAYLGFALTRIRFCDTTWQMTFYCEHALWAKNMTEAPWIFIRSLFTTMFFHNKLDHILFVSLVGLFLIVQSHESHFGSKFTAVIFVSAYFTVAPLVTAFFNIGIHYLPDSEFMQFAFARNWMGGSIGMFQVYGSLATKSRKPIVMLSIPFVFEALNLLNGIDPHISLMHTVSTVFGFLISSRFWRGRVLISDSSQRD